jgi:hypothetical protein
LPLHLPAVASDVLRSPARQSSQCRMGFRATNEPPTPRFIARRPASGAAQAVVAIREHRKWITIGLGIGKAI